VRSRASSLWVRAAMAYHRPDLEHFEYESGAGLSRQSTEIDKELLEVLRKKMCQVRRWRLNEGRVGGVDEEQVRSPLWISGTVFGLMKLPNMYRCNERED
jgi:hypothetical protein